MVTKLDKEAILDTSTKLYIAIQLNKPTKIHTATKLNSTRIMYIGIKIK